MTSCLSTFQNGMGVFQTYTHISIEKIKRELASVKLEPEVGTDGQFERSGCTTTLWTM